MKKLLLLFGLITILFSSCQKSTPPQLSAIPNDAAFVIAFEAKDIIKKGGLDKIDQYKFYERILSEFGEGKALFEKFAKDPKAVGLGIDQIYMFFVPQGENFYFSTAFKMNDSKAFEENLKEILTVSKCSENTQIEDKSTYKILNGANIVWVWNKDLCFMFAGSNLETIKYEEYFAMPAEKSITSVDDFKEFQKQKYDIGVWMAYGPLMKMANSMAGMKFSMLDDLNGVFIHGYMEFKNDEIKASVAMTPKAAVDKFHEKYPIMKKDFDNTLLQVFPENSYFAFKGGISIAEYVSMLKTSIKEMQQQTSQTDSLSPDYEMQPINHFGSFYSEIFENPTVNTVVNALGGDFLFSIYDFAKGPLPIPLASLAFTLKAEDDFAKLVALLPEGTLQKKDDYYVIPTGVMVSVYVAQKGKHVLITDDADAVTLFKKTSGKTLENGKVGKEMKNNLSFFFMNLDVDSYPENIRSLLKEVDQFGNEIANSLAFLSIFKDFTVKAKDAYSCEMSLKMKKGNENSLKQFLTKIDAFTELIPSRSSTPDYDDDNVVEEAVVVEEAE